MFFPRFPVLKNNVFALQNPKKFVSWQIRTAVPKNLRWLLLNLPNSSPALLVSVMWGGRPSASRRQEVLGTSLQIYKITRLKNTTLTLKTRLIYKRNNT